MRLQTYHIEFLDDYFKKNTEGKFTREFPVVSNTVRYQWVYNKENSSLISGDVVFDLAKKGLSIIWAGIDTNENDKIVFEVAISTADEWVDF
jgi:hypothetical protein